MSLQTVPDFITNYARKNGYGAALVDFLNSPTHANGMADWSEKLLQFLDLHPKKELIIFASDESKVTGVNLGLWERDEITYTRAQTRHNIAENIKNHPEIVEALLPYPSLHKWLYVPVEQDLGNGIFPAREFYEALQTAPNSFKSAYENNLLGRPTKQGGSTLVYSHIYSPSSLDFQALAEANDEEVNTKPLLPHNKPKAAKDRIIPQSVAAIEQLLA